MRVGLTFLMEDRVNSDPYGVIGKHGLSILLEIESGLTILYDVGPSFDALIHNALLLKKDLKKVDVIVISHGHYDHANDLIPLLKYIGRKEIPVVLHPSAFDRKVPIRMNSTREDLIDMGTRLIEREVPFELERGIWFSGTVPRLSGNPVHPVRSNEGKVIDDVPDDTSLYLKGKEGIIIISGCGHSGVINIVEHSKEVLKVDKIHALIGGFHGVGQPKEVIERTVNYLSKEEVDILAPCHCSGPLIYRLSDSSGFVDAKVGTSLSFEIEV